MEIKDSAETEATSEGKEITKTKDASGDNTEDITEENTNEDRMVEDNSSNKSNNMVARIVGLAVLSVLFVFVFLFAKNKKNNDD